MLDDRDKSIGGIDLSLCCEDICSFRKFATWFSFMSYIQDSVKGLVDVAIIRIEFSECHGTEAAKKLLAVYPHILVLFVSDDISLCRDVFLDMHPYLPFGIMTPPFFEEDFRRNMQRAVEITSGYIGNTLCIKSVKGYANIQCRNIIYIENEKRILHIYMKNGMVYDCYNKIDMILRELPASFLKIHQSYIINTDNFEEFSDNTIKLNNGVLLPVSRTQKKLIKDKIYELLGKC